MTISVRRLAGTFRGEVSGIDLNRLDATEAAHPPIRTHAPG